MRPVARLRSKPQKADKTLKTDVFGRRRPVYGHQNFRMLKKQYLPRRAF
jgi:hypothetical protein